MKLFSALKTNFAASADLTANALSHLINRITKSNSSAGRSALSGAPLSGEKKRELHMKVSKLFTLLVGSSLLFSASSFAGNGNKKSLHLAETVTIEGKELAPGDYKFTWSGAGPEVKVDILKGKETVASLSAHIVAVPSANKQDGYSATAAQDGRHALNTVFFSGDKFDLEFGDASTAKTAPGTTTSGSN
jgi:hypothetical protein